MNTDTKKIQVMGDDFTSQKNLYGDKKATTEERNAKVNSLYDIAEILSDSKFVGKEIEPSFENSEVKPKNKAHKDVKYWYKFENTISMDGEIYDVTFSIRDMGKTQYQYLIDFHKKGDNSNQPYSHKDLQRAIDELSPKDRVPQNEESVNSYSMRDGEIYSQGKKLSIPEKVRQANNIILDENSSEFRKKDAKGYKVVETLAKDLKKKVKFVKGLTDADGNQLDGAITEDGIYINTEGENPVRWAATHEFSHAMKQSATESWSRYQNYVVSQMKRNGSYESVFVAKAKAYGTADANYINEEIAADYIGDLFSNVDSLADFIRESRRYAVTIRDMWYSILDKLGLLGEKKKAQLMWRDAYREAMLNVKDGKVENEGKSETKYKLNPTFEKAFDNWVENLNRRNGIPLKVGSTSEALMSIGVIEQDIRWDTTKINDTLKKHPDIDIRMLKSIPNLIENPVLIMEERNKKASKGHGNNRIFMLGELYNENGLPIIAFLELETQNRDGIYLNEIKIVSTHSRVDETAPESFDNTKNFVKNSHLLYLDPNKNRTNSWLARNRLQLPFLPTTYGPINKITYSEEYVKSNPDKFKLEDRVKGDDLLNSLDTVEEIKNIGGTVDDNGIVTLYHATNNENAKSITDSKKMSAKEDGLFFSTKADGEIQGYGKTVLEFKIPVEMLEMNDVFQDEIHFRIPLKNKNEVMDVSKYLVTTSSSVKGENKKSISGTRLSEVEGDPSITDTMSSAQDDTTQKFIKPGAEPRRDVKVPESVKEGTKVRQFARTAAEAETLSDETSEGVLQDVEDGKFNYTPISDKSAMSNAYATLDTMGVEWVENKVNGAISSHSLDKNTVAMAEVLMQRYSEEGQHEKVQKLIVDFAAESTRTAQSLQAISMLKKLDPNYEVSYIDKVVENLREEIIEKNNKKKFGKKHSADIEVSEELKIKLMEAKTEEEREAVRDEIYTEIAEQLPDSWIDKWNAWRYMAMLGNARTHVRNVAGNTAFMPMIAVKNVAAKIIEPIVAKVSGGKIERSKTFKVSMKYREFAKQDAIAMRKELQGGGKHNPSDIIRDKKQIFDTKALEWLRVKVGDSLEFEDWLFLRHHYKVALSNYLAANKIDLDNMSESTLDRARKVAIKEAQRNTYRDASAFANALSSFSKKNAATALLVEGLMPFKKTPVNVLKRGVEYSPAGLVKVLTTDLYKVTNPDEYEMRKNTHVISGFRVPDSWKIYRGFDFGYSKPFSVGWYAVDHDGRLYRIRELYGCTGTPNEGVRWEPAQIARKIKEIEREDINLKGKYINGIADPSIFDESRGESVAVMMEREGVYFEKGDNTRIAGKMQLHNRFAFDENGIPMLYVFNTCKHFIRTVPALVYSQTDVEDIDTATEDHIYDEVRYVCMANPINPPTKPSKPKEYNPLEDENDGIKNWWDRY